MAELLHRRHNLSGVLAFSGHHFFQVIEGTDLDVEDLLNLIRADTRHDLMRILCDETVHCRMFDRWTSCIVDSLDLADRIEQAHSHSADPLCVATLMEAVTRPDMSHELTSTWAALNR